MVQLNSHLEQYSTLDSFSPLPPGEYRVGIMASELKNTRSGNSMLSFTYEVMDGEFQGRKIWDNLNLWHNNPKTVEIAMRQLKSIATVSGYPESELYPGFLRAARPGDEGETRHPAETTTATNIRISRHICR